MRVCFIICIQDVDDGPEQLVNCGGDAARSLASSRSLVCVWTDLIWRRKGSVRGKQR